MLCYSETLFSLKMCKYLLYWLPSRDGSLKWDVLPGPVMFKALGHSGTFLTVVAVV